MGRIERLAPDVANQIAAGEVVERPAAVVKELVENAIDASATRVSILVELGGKRLIRVDDDGHGMDPEDARLSIERHATSKIRQAGDLEHIATLGFRGEALPSIASVSRFVLRTRARGQISGVEIRVEAGTVVSLGDAAMPEGTSVEVGDLFYNLPARRKFLKSDGGEAAQISKTVTQLALCYPEIGFTLRSAGRLVVQCPPVSTIRDRIYQLYGDRHDLVEVRRDSGDVSIYGYVAALADSGPTRGPQHLFINRRVVKDRTIAHAVIDAYASASIKERSPEVHLFIDMPPEAVDVNVHPTKAEVRFRDQSYMHQVVRRAVGDALGEAPAPAITWLAGGGAATPTGITLSLPHAYPDVAPSPWARREEGHGAEAARVVSGAGRSLADAVGAADRLTRAGLEGATSDVSPDVVARPTTTQTPLIPLGQFRDTFIIAVDDEGIAVIDQHVAHERILFERITERLSAGRLESQRVLEPMLVELSADGRDALLAHAADLDRLGFEIEEFGGQSVRVAGYPAMLGREDCERAVRALAEDLEGLDRGGTVHDAVKRMAATMACHAAVKAHDRLTPEKMRYLLEELRRTAYSTICPHGRPVMLRLGRRDLEKSFQRI